MTEKNEMQVYRLLVIDDEQIVGKRLKQVFDKIGFEVDVLIDPQLALESIATKTYDIVVTDLKMEVVDGMEILARVKATNPRTQVIIITGFASEETSALAHKGGVFEFLAKPVRLDAIRQSIFRALEVVKESDGKA